MKIRRTTTMLAMGCIFLGCNGYKAVNTFTEAHDPVPLSAKADSVWKSTPGGLNAVWGNPNFQYSRSEVPQVDKKEKYELTAWKGETVSAQILLWNTDSTSGVKCDISQFVSPAASMDADIAQARFVRYTLADRRSTKFTKGGPQMLGADMLDSLSVFDMSARTTRPVWVTIEVPQDAKPGVYLSDIRISHNGAGSIVLPFQLKVVDRTLPSPEEWNFHLDLWQHPTAVARTEGLELWSDAHFAAMKKVMTRLAKAGQKVITANLNKDPWNHQCYDAYEDMIKWTLGKDGVWRYDYKIFDKWVEFMMSLGIDRMINCYSMVPWNCELHYMDEAKGEIVTVVAEPGKCEFAKMWKPFLVDFQKHLASKGWLEITNIAMDERSPEAMDAAVKVLKECAPEMGFAIADNHKSYKRYNMMRDVCVAQDQNADHDDILMRRKQGFNTTFYVCCVPFFPNTFTYSDPYEAELLGWYAVMADYDGMLRWAYNSWPEKAEYDSRFGSWSSGDTFFVYPYNRSSIRFERMLDGIEVFEKVHVLRKAGVDMTELEKVFDEMRKMNINDSSLPWSKMLDKADAILNRL